MASVFRKLNKLYFIPPIITQWFIRIVTKTLFSCFCNFKVEGLSNLDDFNGPLIFAANHSSEWDGPLVRTAMPMKCRFGPMFYVGMDKEFYRTKNFGLRGYLYGSSFFKLFGAYPVYYGLKNYKESLRNHIVIIKDGGSVTFFPEGKRTKDGSISEFKSGVIALSHYTNTPIIPVYIRDMYKLTRKSFFSGDRKVLIRFGAPYYVEIDNSLSEKQILQEYKKKANELRSLVLLLSDTD